MFASATPPLTVILTRVEAETIYSILYEASFARMSEDQKRVAVWSEQQSLRAGCRFVAKTVERR
jgi:hypothetical protein